MCFDTTFIRPVALEVSSGGINFVDYIVYKFVLNVPNKQATALFIEF